MDCSMTGIYIKSYSILQTVLCHSALVSGIAGDDMYLVTASKDNTAKIWRSLDFSHAMDLLGHKSPVLTTITAILT